MPVLGGWLWASYRTVIWAGLPVLASLPGLPKEYYVYINIPRSAVSLGRGHTYGVLANVKLVRHVIVCHLLGLRRHRGMLVAVHGRFDTVGRRWPMVTKKGRTSVLRPSNELTITPPTLERKVRTLCRSMSLPKREDLPSMAVLPSKELTMLTISYGLEALRRSNGSTSRSSYIVAPADSSRDGGG